MEKGTSWTAYIVSWCTTIFGGLTLDKVALIVGISTSIGTFAINWYYRAKAAKVGRDIGE